MTAGISGITSFDTDQVLKETWSPATPVVARGGGGGEGAAAAGAGASGGGAQDISKNQVVEYRQGVFEIDAWIPRYDVMWD